MEPEPEDVDLEQLARMLGALPAEHRRGFVEGKTAMRDIVARKLSCSNAMAEQLVDTLALRGMIHYSEDDSESLGPGYWKVNVPLLD